MVSVGDATHVTVALPRSATPGTYVSGGLVLAGGGAFPCKVLQVQPENCKTVDYDADTGFATWDNNGAAALIII